MKNECVLHWYTEMQWHWCFVMGFKGSGFPKYHGCLLLLLKAMLRSLLNWCQLPWPWLEVLSSPRSSEPWYTHGASRIACLPPTRAACIVSWHPAVTWSCAWRTIPCSHCLLSCRLGHTPYLFVQRRIAWFATNPPRAHRTHAHTHYV